MHSISTTKKISKGIVARRPKKRRSRLDHPACENPGLMIFPGHVRCSVARSLPRRTHDFLSTRFPRRALSPPPITRSPLPIQSRKEAASNHVQRSVASFPITTPSAEGKPETRRAAVLRPRRHRAPRPPSPAPPPQRRAEKEKAR